MQIISNIALISINETAIVQLISFLLFVFIINRVMLRPLRKATHERGSFIENIRQDIIAAEKKVEDLSNQLEKRQSEVKNEAFELNKELEQAGGKEAAEMLAAVRQEIKNMRVSAEEEIKTQSVAARKQLKNEMDVLVVNIMEQVLKRRLVP